MLKEIRKNIDDTDSKILELLIKRFAETDKIAKLKKTVYDENREKEILDNLKSINKKRLDEDFLENIWIFIMKESKKRQRKIKDQGLR
ncbi:MAG: hypothetical protein CSB55_07865 [Candidatus Cloacimonadota bacterium]|nr:MAG: hypothetical protein CSB55_07865 [Candidatus Cloacimonadota bacterium]